jgi:glycosyltransferase involved in cell wall biosynthesis
MIPAMSDILHVIDENAPADMLEQLSLLVRPGEEIVSVGPPPKTNALSMVAKKVFCPMGYAPLSAWRLRDAAGDARILHAWSVRAAQACLAAARGMNYRCVFSLPCADASRWPKSLRKALAGGVLRTTIPTGVSAEALIRQGARPGGIRVLAPPAPMDSAADRRASARRQLGVADDEILLAAPTPMVRHAGHDWASWVHAILRHGGFERVKLLLNGSGPHEPHVRFFARTTGFIHEELFPGDSLCREDAIAAADVVLFFHKQDVGVHALALAMAAGKCIVASNTPDIAECTPDGQAAMLVAPGEIRSYTAAVMRALEDSSLATQLGRRAKEIAEEKFPPAASRGVLDDLYASLR